MLWNRWFRKPKASRKPPRKMVYRKPARRILVVEALEDRYLLSLSALSATALSMLSDTAAGNLTGPASVSQDGRYIVYTDTAANLSANQTMNSKTASDVFLFDRATGTTTLVSHSASSATTTADGTAKNAVISADGKWIAFVSNSDNLVSGETLPNDT
jgi:Tol biopolymer transport system component